MLTLHPVVGTIVENVQRVVLGKTKAIELCVAALLARGHLLIEDVPGVGKTVLARSLAISIGADFARIQFTPDLLPGDITGVQVFNPETRRFEFHPGPIMTQVVLADEINRATPKTQSALLESMDERSVTVDGLTHHLPDPFIVLATQNPLEFEGTFPLPESQLDRFLISLHLGYPDREDELRMLANLEEAHPVEHLRPVIDIADLLRLQEDVKGVSVGAPVRDYLLDLVEETRRDESLQLGASPRASIALFRLSQAWALLHGREYVLPDDVKAVAPAVLRHRLMPAILTPGNADEIVTSLLRRVPVPGNRG